MPAFKQPDLADRAAAAKEAKLAALAKMKARPKPTEEELAAKKAARLEREAEERRKRAEEKERLEAEAEAARIAAEEEAERIRKEAEGVKVSESVRKAARDLKYAKRKARRR
ncbi:DUF6481 family protein [Pacificimonas sp. ICDLI1SI03]|jgi:hypothetical protein|tara:strand:- start:103961 stop:104296 length:336 start_codon:yes stop_codon:yes gene_type:complete